jgi:hypothetical protein
VTVPAVKQDGTPTTARIGRGTTRRSQSCPSNWRTTLRGTNQGPRSGDGLRCPEKDQPYWKGSSSAVLTYEVLNNWYQNDWDPYDSNRLYDKAIPDHTIDATTKVKTPIYNTPYTTSFTCDEWPAAQYVFSNSSYSVKLSCYLSCVFGLLLTMLIYRWIEGGKGAATYCK